MRLNIMIGLISTEFKNFILNIKYLKIIINFIKTF